MKLLGKIALITGGNSGIGLGIATKLREEGAKGVIVGRDSVTLDSAHQYLGGDFLPLRCDVTNLLELVELYQKTQELVGKIDILVVNAGGAISPGTIQAVENVDENSFDVLADLNLKNVFFTVQKALPHLNENASIILVSSIAAYKEFPGMSVYSACKTAVSSLARSMSAELMSRGIKVNVLNPNTIDTLVFDKFGFSGEEVTSVKKQLKDLIPMQRASTPNEMGGVATFLASSDLSYVVGAEIIADGGVVNL